MTDGETSLAAGATYRIAFADGTEVAAGELPFIAAATAFEILALTGSDIQAAEGGAYEVDAVIDGVAY